MKQRLILVLINLFGGIIVLRSYYLGLSGDLGAEVFWGGVPESIWPLFYASMVVAALGYVAFLFFLVAKVQPGEATIGGRLGYGVFYLIFILILVASAFWMPLTRAYAEEPTAGMWVAVRVVLAVVGLASIALAWALLWLRPGNRGVSYWAAVAGSTYFAFHTAILDAVVWAALFRS